MSTSPIEIKYLDRDKIQEWDNFVLSNDDATFFHRAGWKSVIEKSFGHSMYYMYALHDNKIVGILPLGHVRSRLFGNSLISIPFCVYGGIVAVNSAVHDALQRKAEELATELKVDCLELRNIRQQNEDWIKKDLYVTFRKTIDADPEVNMSAIPRKQRAMVRKGIKAGLESIIDNNVDRLYDAYSQSVHNLGTPVFSKRYFTNLKQEFGDDCEILIVNKGRDLVSGVMSFYFKDQVLPYYGGGTGLSRDVKGNDFMYWELMRLAAERGIKIFDYGRSKQGTGSYSFKKNWGFDPEPLHYEFKLVAANEMPDVNPLNPKYQFFIKMWKRMPLAMTKLVGPVIARNLG